MTPEVAVGIAASIRVCIRGENRCNGKAMFTANHESDSLMQRGGLIWRRVSQMSRYRSIGRTIKLLFTA